MIAGGIRSSSGDGAWRGEQILRRLIPGEGVGPVDFEGFFLIRSLLRTARCGRVEVECLEICIEIFWEGLLGEGVQAQ